MLHWGRHWSSFQTLDYAGKDCQGQTALLITNIVEGVELPKKLRRKFTQSFSKLDRFGETVKILHNDKLD